jgi:hypothetical protein
MAGTVRGIIKKFYRAAGIDKQAGELRFNKFDVRQEGGVGVKTRRVISEADLKEKERLLWTARVKALASQEAKASCRN